MLKSRFSGIFCILIMTAALILTLLFMHGDLIGIKRMTASPAYETRLFDRSRVHEIEILMEDPEAFFAEATKE